MFKNRLELFKILMQIMHITLIFYVQVLMAYISSSILTFFKHFVCLGFFIIF